MRPALLIAAIGSLAPAAQAADSVFARAARIDGDGWTAHGLETLIDFRREALAGEIVIERIDLDDGAGTFSDTRIRCGRIELSADEFACLDAQFSFELPGSGHSIFPGEVRYDRRSGAVAFDLREVPLAGGVVRVQGSVLEGAVDARFSGRALALDALAALAGEFGVVVEGWSAAGHMDVSGSLRARGGALAGIALDAALNETSVSNEAGTIVSAAAGGRVVLDATRTASGWEFTVDVAGESGEAYVEPVYANLAEHAVKLSASGAVDDGLTTVDLERYSLSLGAEVEATGALAVTLPEAEDADIVLGGSVTLVDASFATLYSGLLQVFLAGTLVGDLETAGTLSGVVTFENNSPTSADLVFEDVIADDRQGRFAIYELEGEVHWPGPDGAPGQTPASHLHWQSARAYDIPVGEARIDARLGGDDVELVQAVRIPTMGGALRINRFALGNFGRSDASGLLDAELEPIQLGQLTSAFGWPAFSGSLSGRLPLLQYDGEVVTVGGTLTARAFGGDIEFGNLRLEQPFGLVPELYGDLRLRRLDLEQVTNTFSFGLIQGRLSGDVTGLQMIDWRPVAMDLYLYTPREDPGRRRISQRAVENLASFGGGGGAAAALSSGFMSFFDVFSYRRIGLRCVLENGVCKMSGAGPAGDSDLGHGYYIVQGSGLPRIDVVGYRHEVDWSQLVRQLVQVTESGGPTVR